MMQGEKVRLRERKPADMLRETIWSTPELRALDPSIDIIYNSQWFSIETLAGVHIGVCGIYNTEGEEGQLGIRIGDRNYWSKGYGADAVSTLVGYYLTVGGLKRIRLKVLSTNVRAYRCYEKCGFVECGKMVVGGYEFIAMERRNR